MLMEECDNLFESVAINVFPYRNIRRGTVLCDNIGWIVTFV